MKIAVVDDYREDAQRLQQYLQQYQMINDLAYQIQVFQSSIEFLETFRGEYDIVFLDVEMPGSDGLEVAREIRAMDQSVGIIFVTNMAQYAVNGYEVNAIDFMVKPVGYYVFTEKLEKAFRFVQSRNQHDILLKTEDGILRLGLEDIYYIEKDRDYLIFHCKEGDYRKIGSIRDLKEKLETLSFAECMAGCLVNIDHVNWVGKDMIRLRAGHELPLSRRQKKPFTQAYINYVGGV